MADTTTDHMQRLAVRDDLLTTLTDAARQRHQRYDLIDGEPAWVAYERSVMHDAVNRWRSKAGLPSVDVAEVQRAEDQACGHVDYAAKWALYCAELVVEVRRG